MKTFAFTLEGLEQAKKYNRLEQIKDYLKPKNVVVEQLLLLALLLIISQLILYLSPITTIAYKAELVDDAITLFNYMK